MKILLVVIIVCSTIGENLIKIGLERIPRCNFKFGDWEFYLEMCQNKMAEIGLLMRRQEK